MAARAEGEGLGKLWDDVRRIRSMLGEGTVAGFAIDPGVLTGFFHFENIGVAFFAGQVSGETWFAS